MGPTQTAENQTAADLTWLKQQNKWKNNCTNPNFTNAKNIIAATSGCQTWQQTLKCLPFFF